MYAYVSLSHSLKVVMFTFLDTLFDVLDKSRNEPKRLLVLDTEFFLILGICAGLTACFCLRAAGKSHGFRLGLFQIAAVAVPAPSA